MKSARPETSPARVAKPIHALLFALLVLSACYTSHEAPRETSDAGVRDIITSDIVMSDIVMEDDAADVSLDADECVSPERCGVWVDVRWQADFPAGVIDRVTFVSDMSCYAGVLVESTSIIGPSVLPNAPRSIHQSNVCSGCFFLSARALDADGRELARGREDFCSDTTREVLVTLR